MPDVGLLSGPLALLLAFIGILLVLGCKRPVIAS